MILINQRSKVQLGLPIFQPKTLSGNTIPQFPEDPARTE